MERPLDKIIGDHLWHGSIILAYAILHGAQAVPDARTIIELGAGCGLASLSIEQVLNDCEVTILATDLPEVVETTLSETLNGQNGWKSSVKSESLVWDSTNDCKRLLENISDRRSLWLLAADVLYNPSSHEAFLETMSSLCTAFEHSIVTIAYRPRTAGDDAFFDMASNRGFPFSLKLKLADVQIWQYCNAVGN